MLSFLDLQSIPPHVSMQITDAIDQRDKIIDALCALIKSQNNEQNNEQYQDTTDDLTRNTLLAKIRELENSLNTMATNNVPHDAINKTELNNKCVDYLTNKHNIDIDFFRNKIEGINNILNILKAKQPPNITPHDEIQKNLLAKKKRLLIGEYYFNNILTTHMASFECDRIINA
jgi:hypothetical protein